jgi:hypothetical protein
MLDKTFFSPEHPVFVALGEECVFQKADLPLKGHGERVCSHHLTGEPG